MTETRESKIFINNTENSRKRTGKTKAKTKGRTKVVPIAKTKRSMQRKPEKGSEP